MVKGIIFDFDGVIHDTFDLGYKINKQLTNLSKEEYKDMFNGNIYKHKALTPEAIKEFFELQNEQYKTLKIEQKIKVELEKLKKIYDLFIVSSNMEETIKNYLGNNDITHIFKEVLGMESHHSKKEKFRLLMDKHDLHEHDSIFVTDTLGDILEANQIGLPTIAVDYGFHERGRLLRGNPIKIISDFAELLPLAASIQELP